MTRPPIAEGLPHTSEREPGRTAYSTDGCRCDECREANAAYSRGRRGGLSAAAFTPKSETEEWKAEGARTGRSRGELVALAVAAMFAPPIEDPAPLGEAPGQGTTRPPAPTIAHVYTDPDGDRLTLLAVNVGPADWSLVLTTADGEVERDVLVEDDETLAGFARALLGAIEDRSR